MGHDGRRVHVVLRREGNREPHEFAPLAGAYLPRSRARGPDKPHEPSGLRVPRLRTPGATPTPNAATDQRDAGLAFPSLWRHRQVLEAGTRKPANQPKPLKRGIRTTHTGEDVKSDRLRR